MIQKLELENYRNHRKFSLCFKDLVLIIGPNGAGKSNIIEAIGLLSFCSSYRDEDKKNLISHGQDYARIVAGDREVFIQKSPRLCFKAKSKGIFRKQSEFIGDFLTVIFSPESIELVSGSPRERRRFLDILISQIDRRYLKTLLEYEKVRKERNSLLVAIKECRSGREELRFWDEEMIRLGAEIIKTRSDIISQLNLEIADLYGKISGDSSDKMILVYQSSLGNFGNDFKRNIERDISTGRTNIGPHREDFQIFLNQTDSKYFSSRGEKRSIVLALKIAEAHLLENIKNEKPLLLLDDIFSEFDCERRKHLIELISNYQAVITTTEIDEIDSRIKERSEIIEIKKDG